ncbi:uncharacterized protein N7500_009429 [Penicillium coprophilum]|uniref:uncharacterized protein n=1 Tax=Penicillium coprophilum TaxID=36646 RepID=UPI00238EE22D|nr:uncharacterized protein N7500_009429 [Penicillium coprophilum]KAJ5153990.1 hypothetical protein N7500_009429 [Penicillium coprophilum]
MSGHEAIVCTLLDKDVEETARYTVGATKENYNWTPRQFAEINGHTGSVNITDTSDDNVTDAMSIIEEYWIALHCKSTNKERGIVKLLADNSIEVYSTSKDEKWAPLYKGINFMANDSQPQPHGHARCGHDLETAIKRLLQKDRNPRAGFLENTAILGHTEGPKDGHAAATDLSAGFGSPHNGSHGEPRPLHLAAHSGHEEVVSLLIDAGADIDAGSWLDKTPLHCAVKHGQDTIMWSLLNAGANVKLLDAHAKLEAFNNLTSVVGGRVGATSLHLAALDGHPVVVRQLLEAGAEIEAKTRGVNREHTPLHLAAENRHQEVVRHRLTAKANLHATTTGRGMPLHLAATGGYEAVVQQLLDVGANPHLVNKNTQTPYNIAVKARNYNEAVVNLLLNTGQRKTPQQTMTDLKKGAVLLEGSRHEEPSQSGI